MLMTKVIKLADMFSIKKVIEKLIKQQINLPVDISFELFNLHKKMNEMEEFFFQRMNIVFNTEYINFDELNSSQKLIMNATLDSEIDIEVNVDRLKKLVEYTEVKLTIDDIRVISKLLE